MADWTVSYICPIDYELYEFSDLVDSLSGVYDKLQLVLEDYNPFSTYDSKRRYFRGPFPSSRLRVARIRYTLSENLEHASLELVLEGSELLGEVLLVVDIITSWPKDAKFKFIRDNHLTEEEFEGILAGSDPRALEEVRDRRLEEKYGLNLMRLFQYVKPELEGLDSNRAGRVPGQTFRQDS